MAESARIALFSTTDIDIQITTDEVVGWHEMPTKDAGETEALIKPPRGIGAWRVSLKGGVIYGFITSTRASFSSERITVIAGDGKDPWPPPPPPPPYEAMQTFRERFELFLKVGGVAATPDPVPNPPEVEESRDEEGRTVITIRPGSARGDRSASSSAGRPRDS